MLDLVVVRPPLPSPVWLETGRERKEVGPLRTTPRKTQDTCNAMRLHLRYLNTIAVRAAAAANCCRRKQGGEASSSLFSHPLSPPPFGKPGRIAGDVPRKKEALSAGVTLPKPDQTEREKNGAML